MFVNALKNLQFYFKMAEAQILIIKQLKDCMEVSDRFVDRHEILVDVPLEGGGFLASPDFLSVFSSDHSKSLPSMKCYLNSFCVIVALLVSPLTQDKL
jgi:hypothetical protein